MNKMKETKGITLIALVITIIVLLILAGITIALIVGQNSAPEKAVQARIENDKGAAKDAATMLVAEKVQDYYEEKYVKSPATTTATDQLAYIAEKLGNGVTTGDYRVTVTGAGAITVTKGGESLATGTVSTEGVISWGGQQNENIEGSIIVGSPQTDGDAPQVGESVNYDPGNLTTASVDLPEGTEIERTKVASVTMPSGVTMISDATASGATEWKILDYNSETGEVLIVPTNGTLASIKLYGMAGYNNGLQALDAVSQIYLNPTYAKNARSITVEDVNKLSGFNPENYLTAESRAEMTWSASWNHRCGMDADTLEIINYGSRANRNYVMTLATTTYDYDLKGDASTIIGNKGCWIASRAVCLNGRRLPVPAVSLCVL